jgi:hypothetical protein
LRRDREKVADRSTMRPTTSRPAAGMPNPIMPKPVIGMTPKKIGYTTSLRLRGQIRTSCWYWPWRGRPAPEQVTARP